MLFIIQAVYVRSPCSGCNTESVSSCHTGSVTPCHNGSCSFPGERVISADRVLYKDDVIVGLTIKSFSRCADSGYHGCPTSMILSAISANLPIFISLAEARIIWTLDRSRCKNSLRKSELSMGVLPPSNCCILRSNWVGLWSPSSSAVRSCQIFWHSQSVICKISCSFNFSQGFSSSGSMRRYWTSVAYSVGRAQIISLYLVLEAVMLRWENCTSTCMNQTEGLAGQNRGKCVAMMATLVGGLFVNMSVTL